MYYNDNHFRVKNLFGDTATRAFTSIVSCVYETNIATSDTLKKSTKCLIVTFLFCKAGIELAGITVPRGSH